MRRTSEAPMYLMALRTRLETIEVKTLSLHLTEQGGKGSMLTSMFRSPASPRIPSTTSLSPVQDTGPGIPSEKKGALFEPYVRGESNQPGIGLGLATVKRLTEAHGGRVGVESSPGAGSTFWFELPKGAPPVTRGAEPRPSQPPATQLRS